MHCSCFAVRVSVRTAARGPLQSLMLEQPTLQCGRLAICPAGGLAAGVLALALLASIGLLSRRREVELRPHASEPERGTIEGLQSRRGSVQLHG